MKRECSLWGGVKRACPEMKCYVAVVEVRGSVVVIAERRVAAVWS